MDVLAKKKAYVPIQESNASEVVAEINQATKSVNRPQTPVSIHAKVYF